MKVKALILATVLTFSFTANIANALTPEQEVQVNRKMQELVINLQQGNLAEIADIMPPKIFVVMAKRAKTTPKQFKTDMVQFTNALAANVTFDNIHYDLRNGIEGHSPLRDYMFLPYTFDMRIGGKKHPIKENLLFLSDNNQWYIARIQEPSQLNTLKQAYPDLADIKLPNFPK